MFAKGLIYDQTNTFHDQSKNFSFSPPQNWIILNNIPASLQSKAIAIFSNNNHTGLATLEIFYKPISQQLVSVLRTLSDREILSEISNELSYKGTDSQTTVLQLGLQRYQDGNIVKTVTLTQYPNDTINIQNEQLIFFLNDDREYTLLLTSNPQDFNLDQKYFESSANTFYVSSNENPVNHKMPIIGPPVSEFGPLAGMIIAISIIGVVIISKRFRFYFSQNNSST
jgi:hypothetical protein